jgi:CheY-like chemotaxis protein
MVAGPIIIVEDDEDDMDVVEAVLKELNIPNKTIWFQKCMDALNFLQASNEQPFLIISDVNLPGCSGVEFKRLIDQDDKLRKKSIPFVFFSTSAAKSHVDEAYLKLTVQGYFPKGNSYQETKDIVRAMFEYWRFCKHPNSKD